VKARQPRQGVVHVMQNLVETRDTDAVIWYWYIYSWLWSIPASISR